MNARDDIFENEHLRQLLSNLRKDAHIPPEIILADIRGDLSPEGHTVIDSHVRACEQCRQVLDLARKISEEKSQSEQQSNNTVSEDMALPEAISAKATLLSYCLKRRDEIVYRLIRLVLPEELWFSIRPAVAAVRSLRQCPTSGVAGVPYDLTASVFATRSNKGEEASTAEAMVEFVDTVCMSLAKDCQETGEIEGKLAECLAEAKPLIDHVIPTTVGDRQILDIFADEFSGPPNV